VTRAAAAFLPLLVLALACGKYGPPVRAGEVRAERTPKPLLLPVPVPGAAPPPEAEAAPSAEPEDEPPAEGAP
jgi:hypothetical protein